MRKKQFFYIEAYVQPEHYFQNILVLQDLFNK